MKSKQKRVVILGGGFGGVYTALRMLSCTFRHSQLNIKLVSRNPCFEFKPLFPEVLGSRLAPELVVTPLKELFRDTRCQVKLAEVTGIDPGRRIVETTAGSEPFDYLVVGLGGSPKYVNTTRNAEVFTFESLDDCLRLRERLSLLSARSSRTRAGQSRAPKTVVVIGAGPTGIEVACEARHLLTGHREGTRGPVKKTPHEIFLIEASARILPGWGADLRKPVERALKQARVQTLTGEAVSRIGKRRVGLADNRTIAADVIVWSGGLKGLPLYESFEVDNNGRIRVDRALQAQQYGNIFAIGDAAGSDAFTGAVPQSAQAAYQQARLIAENIERSLRGRTLMDFRYVERGQIVPVGGRRAIVRSGAIMLEGFPGWALEKTIFLLRTPGCENKLKLFDGLVLQPLAKRGLRYIEERRAHVPR